MEYLQNSNFLQGTSVLARVLHSPRILNNDGSQGSLVRIVIMVWAGQIWLLVGAGEFSLLQNAQTGSMVCPVSCLLSARFLLPVGRKVACEIDYMLPSYAEVRNGWSYTLLPYILSWHGQ